MAIWFGEPSGTLYVTEGPEDALTLREAGYAFVACSVSSGNMCNLTIPEGIQHVIIFQDNDEAGEKAAKKAAHAYAAQAKEVLIAKAPDGIKDANQLLQERDVEAVRKAVANATKSEAPKQEEESDDPSDGSEAGSEPFKRVGGKIDVKHPDNCRIALSRMGVVLKFDTRSKQIMLSGPDDLPLRCATDADLNKFRMQIKIRFKFLIEKNLFKDFVDYIAHQNPYEPLKERIESVTWDGKHRIDTFLIDYAGADNNEYIKAVTRLMFLGAIKRVYRPGTKFDHVIVLEGPQGCGKSLLIRKLAMEDEYFTDNIDFKADTRTVIERTLGNCSPPGCCSQWAVSTLPPARQVRIAATALRPRKTPVAVTEQTAA
ncbi:MAG: VapE domain-containing protein [Rhodomicrobium sp.]